MAEFHWSPRAREQASAWGDVGEISEMILGEMDREGFLGDAQWVHAFQVPGGDDERWLMLKCSGGDAVQVVRMRWAEFVPDRGPLKGKTVSYPEEDE
jgi:hypothetical protein